MAGATRGAGRGIAVELGAAGATVYVTGRTTRSQASEYQRPETIEETAELVTAAGGTGIAVPTDHLDQAAVESLVAQIRAAHGQLDVLVNDIWGGELLFEWDKAVWEHDLDKGLRLLRLAVDTHLITAHFALPLLISRPGGLLVEVTDGTTAYNATNYRLNPFYDLAKVAVNRMGWSHSRDLRKHGCLAVSLTPGWMRSEMMLEHFSVTEETWRDALATEPHFAISETPVSPAARSRPWLPIPTGPAGTVSRSPAGSSPRCTGSTTSTAPDLTPGATSSRCRTRADRPTSQATAEGLQPAEIPRSSVRTTVGTTSNLAIAPPCTCSNAVKQVAQSICWIHSALASASNTPSC